MQRHDPIAEPVPIIWECSELALNGNPVAIIEFTLLLLLLNEYMQKYLLQLSYGPCLVGFRIDEIQLFVGFDSLAECLKSIALRSLLQSGV